MVDSIKLSVRYDRCETCIFRRRYPKATRDRIFGDVERLDASISCHQYSTESDETGESIDSTVVCKGFYDREPYQTAAMRLAHMIGIVEFVDEAGDAIACPIPQTASMGGYHADKHRVVPRIRPVR